MCVFVCVCAPYDQYFNYIIFSCVVILDYMWYKTHETTTFKWLPCDINKPNLSWFNKSLKTKNLVTRQSWQPRDCGAWHVCVHSAGQLEALQQDGAASEHRQSFAGNPGLDFCRFSNYNVIPLKLSISQMWRFGGDTWFLSCNRWWAVSPQAGGPAKWWVVYWTLGYDGGGVVHYLCINGRQAAAVRAAEDVDVFSRWWSAVH